MTLWVFGDSFSRHFKYVPDTWIYRIGTLLNCDIKAYSRRGVSLEYTYQQFNSVREDIVANDVCIITLTTFRRKWFIKDEPQMPYRRCEDTEVNNAIDYYNEYLNYQDTIDELRLLNFLYNVEYLAKKKHVQTIVFINFEDENVFLRDKKHLFPHIHFVNGYLHDLSLDEFVERSPTIWDWLLVTSDNRLNHLTRTNHFILVDKVINYLQNQVPITLKQGFKTGFVTEEMLNDPQFNIDELYNGYAIKRRNEKD